MANVTVYRFASYDIRADVMVESQRWATMGFIARYNFAAIDGTAVDVPEEILEGELTPHNYNPHSVLNDGGFQRSVR